MCDVGTIEIPFDDISEPTQMTLTVEFAGNVNSYPIWIYPRVQLCCPSTVYETEHFDDRAEEILKQGGIVYLSPKSDIGSIPQSIQAQFSTDFWSVGTFPSQDGGMGQLIDDEHPIFHHFPTERHTNWQWWPMANRRAFILPESLKTIISEMDSYAYLRPMAKLFEGRCYSGRILVSSMGLQELMQYAEARALQYAIYRYLSSEMFVPNQQLEPLMLRMLVP